LSACSDLLLVADPRKLGFVEFDDGWGKGLCDQLSVEDSGK
jgi:hypothetical protein